MNIDWSKAPEATHYDNRRWCEKAFMRKNHNGKDWEYLSRDGNWIMYGPIPDSEMTDLIERPYEWAGEGLPPVGTVCEFNTMAVTDEEWHKLLPLREDIQVTVIAHCTQPSGTQTAVFTFNCTGGLQVEMGVAELFKPIRTPEQIAAEERDKAVREMQGLGGIQRQSAEWIYDAGYRKQVKP